MTLPNWWEAPSALLEIDGHCGPLAAWMVLKHFRKRASVRSVTDGCRYTKRHGTFTVGLAACLKIHGLQVAFHTDPDPHIGQFEKRCYSRAARTGILPQTAIELSEIVHSLHRGCVPIVLFNSESDVGHFSPLIDVCRGNVVLPLADDPKMPIDKFLSRWSQPGILRQCVIAHPA